MLVFWDKSMTNKFSFDADPPQDLIDHVVGIDAGSWLDTLRRGRSVLRDNAQLSSELLLNPKDDTDFSKTERLAVASFVAGLHGDSGIYELYLDLLARLEGGARLGDVIKDLVVAGRTTGPYGAYPRGPLSNEDLNGIGFSASPAEIGERLAAALNHAHFLTYHPRDASVDALETLKAAGWSATAIVTLSQLVSFLTFQIRIIHGLTVLRNLGPAADLNILETTS